MSQEETFDEQGFQDREYYRLLSRNFDVFDELAGCKEKITEAILVLFQGAVGSIGCSSVCNPSILKSFVRHVQVGYKENDYHNWLHVFCVTQQVAVILTDLRASHLFSPRHRFLLMVSAVVHDLGHPGNSNDFEIKTNSFLAIRYDGKSVLENFHIDQALQILKNSDNCDLFIGWTDEERVEAYSFIKACVLATDMAGHTSLLEEISQLIRSKNTITTKNSNTNDSNSPDSQAHSTLDISFSDEEKLVLAKSILHAADISNSVRPFPTTRRLSECVVSEFNKQAANEESLGLSVSPHMKPMDHVSFCRSECGFTQFVARPFFIALYDCFPAADRSALAAIDANIEHWQVLVNS